MTKKEALLATCQASVPDGSLDLALINRGLLGTDAYTLNDQKDVELAAIDVLYGMLTAPDIQEGGYSISHPDFYRKIQARVLQLAQKWNRTDIIGALTPTITGASPW